MAEFNNKDFEKYFEPLLEGARQLNQLLLDNIESLKDFGKVAEQNIKKLDTSKAEDVADLNKQLEILDETTQDLAKTQKDQKKVEQELTKQEKALNNILKEGADFNKELAVEIEKAKIQRTEARKEAKLEAQQQLDLNKTYNTQKKRLAELTNSLINLRLEGKETTETFKEQEREFEELFQTISDAEQEFGRFQRQVGDYAKAGEDAARVTEQLQRSIDRLRRGALIAGGVVAGGGLLGKALKSGSDSSEELRTITEAATKAQEAFFASIAQGAIQATKDTEGLTGLQVAYKAIQGAAEGAAKGVPAFTRTLEQQAVITREIIKLEKELTDSYNSTSGVVTGLENQLLKLNVEFEKQVALSDLNTKSLTERNEALNLAVQASEEAFEIERRILEERVRIAQLEIKLAADNETQRIEARQKFTEANAALIELENRQIQTQIQLGESRSQILQDQFEQDLDILIDYSDNIKSVNERLIADERLSANARQTLINETFREINSSFRRQIELFEELENEERRINKAREEGTKLSETRLEQNERFILSQEQVNELIALNSENLTEEIKQLELSEQGGNRLLGTLREINTQRSELEELIDSNAEALRQENDENDRAFQERQERLALAKGEINSLRELNRQRRENERENVERAKRRVKQSEERVKEQEKELQELVDTEKELQDQLTETQDEGERERLKAQIAASKESRKALVSAIQENNRVLEESTEIAADNQEETIKRRSENLNQLAEAGFDALSQLQQKRIDQADEEISQIDQRTQQLRQAALEGNATASESLAQLDRERAEAAQEKEKALENQQRLEAASAIFSAYTANVESGSETPVADTARDAVVLKSLVDALFYQGADNVGQSIGKPLLPGKDGYIVRVDGSEQIWSNRDQQETGNRTRAEMKEIIQSYDNGTLTESLDYSEPIKHTTTTYSNPELLRKIDSLNSTVESLKMAMPKYDVNWNSVINGITTRIKTGNKVDIKHEANGKGGAFGK